MAQWGRTADDYIQLPLGSPPNYSSTLCSDLNGGCWVAGAPIGLCHVDRLGYVTWGDTALWFREWSFRGKLVPVDTSSVIVVMQRVIRDTVKIYMNRVNTAKELMWGDDGIALVNGNSDQGLFGVIPGPAPNTFLIHFDAPGRRLRLINPDGETLWTSQSLQPVWSENSKILTTSDNCVIAAHPVDRYPRQNPLVEVIKFDADGEELWQRRYAITSELQPTLRGWELSDAESDRDGGVILSTKYKRWNLIADSLRYFSLGIMRISGDGDSMWTHKIYERQVEPIYPDWPGSIVDPFDQCEFILNYAGHGHYFAAWMDNLRHSDDDPFRVISFNDDFELQWDEPLDVIISPAGYGKLEAVDSDTSVIYVWRDHDQDRENINEQWGQRIALNGERLWDDRGNVIISRTPSKQSATTDGNGGVITTADAVFPSVQMMNRNGEIGVVLDPVGVNDYFDKGVRTNYVPVLNIYPNPGNSYLNVELSPVIPNETINYQIYDLIGRSVMTGTIRDFPYLVKDLSRFSSGEYILRLDSPRITAAKTFSLVK